MKHVQLIFLALSISTQAALAIGPTYELQSIKNRGETAGFELQFRRDLLGQVSRVAIQDDDGVATMAILYAIGEGKPEDMPRKLKRLKPILLDAMDLTLRTYAKERDAEFRAHRQRDSVLQRQLLALSALREKVAESGQAEFSEDTYKELGKWLDEVSHRHVYSVSVNGFSLKKQQPLIPKEEGDSGLLDNYFVLQFSKSRPFVTADADRVRALYVKTPERVTDRRFDFELPPSGTHR